VGAVEEGLVLADAVSITGQLLAAGLDLDAAAERWRWKASPRAMAVRLDLASSPALPSRCASCSPTRGSSPTTPASSSPR
jgi:hypothetical protein